MIPPADMVHLMPLFEKYVNQAFHSGNGETSYASLIGKGLKGEAHFWALMEDEVCHGVCTTEFAVYDGYTCLHLITLGTDNKSNWQDWHHLLEDFSRHHGCREIQFWGRKGFSRAIDVVTGSKQEKYKEIYRVFSMELNYDSTK